MKMKEEIDFTRFSEMVARQREFMNFVAQKYPSIYNEFVLIEKEQDKQLELLRKVMNREELTQKLKGAEGREMKSKEEFNLGELKQDTNKGTPRFHRFAYAEEDVKEFIRLCEDNSEEINGTSYIKVSKMQKFAGEKLKGAEE